MAASSFTLCLMLVLAPVVAAFASAAPEAGAPGPTVAREDTLSTQVSEVLVRAPRVTLNEILDRVARGEARRDSLIQDEAFRATVRLVRNASGSAPILVEESVTQVYRKRPHHLRTVLLRDVREKPKSDDDLGVSFGTDIHENIVNFAFQPSARREFTYRIVGRDLVGGHLIYRIEFTPRSYLNPATPSGTVWVDTNDFVILRQEVHFERSPVPILLKGIRRMVVERRRAGEHWVLGRVLLRIEGALPLPTVGRVFDLTMTFDDYLINSGLSDTLFTGHAPPAPEDR
jgi:hypothetical protein